MNVACSQLTTARVDSSFLVVLLLTSALLISVSSVVTPTVHAAGGSVTLTPTSGSPAVGGLSGTTVTISGSSWPVGDAGACTISVSPNEPPLRQLVVSSPTCTLSSGGVLSGSFTVGVGSTAITGPYTVTVTSTVTPADSTTASFSVLPRIVLTPNAGSAGISVTVSGSGFRGGTTDPSGVTCRITGTPVSAAPPVSCGQGPDGTVSGVFTVKSGLSYGGYTVFVWDADASWSPFASAVFTVYAIGVPLLVLTPFLGPTGTPVTVTGSGWNSLDTFVALRADTTQPDGSSPIWGVPQTITCPVSAGAIVTSPACTFTVKSNALGGKHVVNAIGGPYGDSSSAEFIVTSTFVLTPKVGGRGVIVTISGSGYMAGWPTSTDGTGCIGALASVPSGLMSGQTCSVDSNGILTGIFTVASGAGLLSYTVRFTDSSLPGPPTHIVQGSLSDTFTVVGPSIWLSARPPGSGATGFTGTIVDVTGSGWSTADTYITLYERKTTPDFSTDLWGVPGIFTCSLTLGTGTIASGCTFTVKSNALGKTYDIYAVGTPYNEEAHAQFTVQSTFVLTPDSGGRGIKVTISGSGYIKAWTEFDCSAALTSVPSGLWPTTAPDGTSGKSCTVDSSGILSGYFTVADTAGLGAYTVKLTDASYIVQGSVWDTFTLTPATLTLSPNHGPTGTSVTFTGSSFYTWDKSCLVFWASTTTPISGSTCSISTGSASGQFSVPSSGVVPGGYTVTVRGYTWTPAPTMPDGAFGYNSPQDSASATFTAEPSIALLPTSGRPGTNVLVSGSNFALGDTGSCTISSSPSNIISSPLCNIAGGGSMSGSFTVASGATGATYTITVTGTTGDAGHASFIVPPAPTLTLSPILGPAGQLVGASGSNYAGTNCILTAAPSGLFTSASCSIAGGTLTGSFTVASGVSPGTAYTVTVTTNAGAGDSASATFAVTAGPVGTLTLTPISGPTGTVVTGSATGFTTDVSCLLTATPLAILSSQSCTITGAGNVNIGFAVAPGTPAGAYAILVVGNTGKAAIATFTVTIGTAQTLVLSPTSGPQGTTVAASGSNYGGTTCTLSASPSGLFTSSSCSISGGTLTGSFTVASSAPAATYTVTATTNAPGETKSATFTVSGPTFTLSPTSGLAGTAVSASGSNYLGTTCTLSSSPSGLFTSASCSISSGTLSGGFTVASGAALGSYTVTITTNVAGESRTAPFIVGIRPTLTLSPTSGRAGTAVSASGLNYVGTTCTLSSSPSGLFTSSSCSVSAGTLTGAFTVATSASAATYTVTVTTNSGETEPAPFTVIPSPSLVLNPPSGTAGTAASVTGSNYVGTTCTLSASPSGLFSSSSCTISGGTLSGGFTVAISATAGSYTVTVTTNAPGETTSATFTVTKKTTPYCIIATVTFGSEASPAVQFLRGFRDNLVLKTTSGSAFMEVFNAWYYSFSPSVAKIIADNDPLRAPVRVFLYPLLGVLGASAFAHSLFSASPEFAVVVAGLVASSLIGLVYMTLPAIIGFSTLTRRRIRITSLAKGSLMLLAVALAMLAAGELTGSFLLLAVASSAIVLVCFITVPAIVALAVLRPNPK